MLLHPGPAGAASLAGASLLLEGSHGSLGPLQLPAQPAGAALVLQRGNVGALRSLTVTASGAPHTTTQAEVEPGALSHAVVSDGSVAHGDVGSQPTQLRTFVCRACLDGAPHTTHQLQRLRPGGEATYQLRATVARGPGPPSNVTLELLLAGTRGGGGVQRFVVSYHATVRFCRHVSEYGASTVVHTQRCHVTSRRF